MNQLEIKYFIPDKKREKNILLLILIVLSLVILTIVVFIQKPAPLNQNSVSLPPITQDNIFKSSKIRVSDKDSQQTKSDINLMVEDELVITLTTDDDHNYTWQLTKNFDRNVLNLIEIEVNNVKQNTSLSSSSQQWRFKALKEGSVELPFMLIDINNEWKILGSETFKVRVR